MQQPQEGPTLPGRRGWQGWWGREDYEDGGVWHGRSPREVWGDLRRAGRTHRI